MAKTGKGQPFEELFSALQTCGENSLHGCGGAIGALCLARIASQPGVKLLVTAGEQRASDLTRQVSVWLGQRSHRVVCIQSERNSVYDQTAADPDVISSRLRALSMDLTGGGLVIAPVSVVLERFHHPARWLEQSLTLESGREYRRDLLIERLVKCGYRRVSVVEEHSTFAVRGSLLDVFPPGSENPFRLDFWGDDLDSIKLFSPVNQRTFDRASRILIVPAGEFVMDDTEHDKILERVAEEISKVDERRALLLERRYEHMHQHPDFRDYIELKPFLDKGVGFLWDYWSNFSLMLEEGEQIFNVAEEFFVRLQGKYQTLDDLTPLLPPHFYYHHHTTLKDVFASLGFAVFSRFGDLEESRFAGIEVQAPPSDPSRESFLKDLRQLLDAGWAVAIVIEDETRLNNLRGLLGERGVRIHSSTDPLGIMAGSVLFINGPARRGFKDFKRRISVFCEEDIYMGPARETAHRRHATQQNLLHLQQIVPGDIVVHADHGVAEFRGIQTMTAAGNTREYMLLQYAGTDRLYVPTDQVHKVSKYLGMEGHVPRIHGLNSRVWFNHKNKVNKNVEMIARELLELYAQRLASSGFAFSPDCDMQRQMEEKFPFSETPDQMKAIIATKEDMQQAMPMDRLVCGDVGYGKTEVAMRAAFKAVCSGKQVAVLAPTTLLAFQHYQTIVARFEGFPVSIDMVSRLRKPAEQRETLKKVKAGTVDILIGTHRLLSSDIHFRDLGLLIVDEEQRFGVKHKERLKKMKANIDVLTLTATPIPRTMQMAMSGIRQISIIDTAPQDRRPVQTYVAPFDDTWVKRAIIEELKRAGQVYYVFNRVEKIDQKAAFIRELVPEARVVVAHGQMPENQVEKTMLEFVQGKHDVLLATTIIESGLDIPNVNTLIVDQAEMLGLSQMYQLRGRVGRSPRQAWAYFFYARGKKLTKEASDRLETIEEHTALGSGFKIALRDLQIRGAGNILGETQSGHIASVGFSLYMEMLEEAVSRIKSGKHPDRVECAVEVPVTAYFPISYVPDEETRVELYSRLARCNDLLLLEEIQNECIDRFGKIPDDSVALFSISRCRILAGKVGVKKITRVINHLRFEFVPTRLPDIGRLFKTGESILQQVYFEAKDKYSINLTLIHDKTSAVFADAEAFLLTLLAVRKQDEEKENENGSVIQAVS